MSAHPLAARQPASVGPQVVTFNGCLFRRQFGVTRQQPPRNDVVGCPIDRFDADQPTAAEAEYREIAGCRVAAENGGVVAYSDAGDLQLQIALAAPEPRYLLVGHRPAGETVGDAASSGDRVP